MRRTRGNQHQVGKGGCAAIQPPSQRPLRRGHRAAVLIRPEALSLVLVANNIKRRMGAISIRPNYAD